MTVENTLNPDLILTLINNDANTVEKRQAKIGERYYEADHDIKQFRVFYINDAGELVEDTERSNIKIPHPFFTELVDQKTQHMLSGDAPIVRSDIPALQKELDLYYGDKFKAELSEQITGVSAKGFDYLYSRKGKEDRLEFLYAYGMGIVEVSAKENGNPDDDNDYIIRHYLDKQKSKKGIVEVTKIEVWDKEKTYYYVKKTGKLKKGETGLDLDPDAKINPRPHYVYRKGDKTYGDGFGYIPFWRLDNNRNQTSDLNPIKALIDDYDLMSCGLSNNLQDISEGVYVVKGYKGNNLTELQHNIRTKKIVGVGKEGDVDIRTINIPYQARQTKLDLDEKNIYRFGMGLNTAGLKDTNATTNFAIKTAYTLLDLKCNKLESRVKAMIRSTLDPVLEEINKINGTGYTQADVYIEFERKTITNDIDDANIKLLEAQKRQTEITTLLNLASKLPDELNYELIFEQLDLNYEDYKAQVEEWQKLNEGRTDLNAASEALSNAQIEGGGVVEQI